jgi:hypothetical protein
MRKGKVMEWMQVVRVSDSLPSQEAVEAFWDEVTMFVDPARVGGVPIRVVQMALKAAAQAVAETGQEGQAVLEYIAVIALVAIVLFVAATWLKDSGILEQVQSVLQVIP